MASEATILGLREPIEAEITEQYADLMNSLHETLNAEAHTSVDRFLESHRTDEALVRLGKHMIAAIMLHFEKDNYLHLRSGPENHWYQYLCERILNARYDELEAIGSAVSFITFNYDRSLEQFICNSFGTREGKTRGEWTAKIREHIRIVHLHGQLGVHPSFAPDGSDRAVPYGSAGNNPRPGEIACAADQIKILHDVTAEDDPEYTEARQMMSDAETIIFLGFGYDDDNLERLRIREQAGKFIGGTTVGMTSTELERVVRRCKPALPWEQFQACSDGCYEYLRNSNRIQELIR